MRIRYLVSSRVVKGWALAAIGFILSPLSWWNDLLVNIPLAYLFAWPFGALNERLFLPALVFGYWLTNIIGMLLMHTGFSKAFPGSEKGGFRQAFWKNFWIACGYTLFIVFLAGQGWLTFPCQFDQVC